MHACTDDECTWLQRGMGTAITQGNTPQYSEARQEGHIRCRSLEHRDSYWQLAVEAQCYSVRTAQDFVVLCSFARDLEGPGRHENRQQQRSVASMPAHHSNVTLATALLDDALSLTEIGCGV
jgi:hypothetical protein